MSYRRRPIEGFQVSIKLFLAQNRITLQSGNLLLAQALQKALSVDRGALQDDVTVVLDAPWGAAAHILDELTLEDPGGYSVVITDNPCGEYWYDLYDLGATVLIAGAPTVIDLALVEDAISHATKGRRRRITPDYQTPLTPAERETLRYCAYAMTNKEIADVMGVAERTVKNRLVQVFSKLQLDNRSQAIRYYWGAYPVGAPPKNNG